VTGGIFASFLIIHFITTISANYGPLIYNETLRQFRKFYQHPLIEPIFIAVVLIHASVGVLEFCERRQRKKNSQENKKKLSEEEKRNGQTVSTPLALTLHRYAGLFLAIIVVGHVTATRLVPYMSNAPFSFSHLSFSLDLLPMIFYPYYSLLALGGLYHLSYGILLIFQKASISSKLWWRISVFGVFALIISAIITFGSHPARDLGAYVLIALEPLYVPYVKLLGKTF